MWHRQSEGFPSDAEGGICVGDELAFSLNYGALVAAMTSEYVKKRPLKAGVPPEEGA